MRYHRRIGGILRMGSIELLRLAGYLEIGICLAALCVLLARRRWRSYWALGSFLAVRLAAGVTLRVIAGYSHSAGHSMAHVYHTYFYIYWGAFAAESVLMLLILWGVFRNTMGPGDGLRRAAPLVLLGAATLVVARTLGLSFAPPVIGRHSMIIAISQLQRASSLLTLAVLALLFARMRRVGVSYRNTVFGVAVGLAVMASSDLAQSAWLPMHPSSWRLSSLLSAAVSCTVLAIWTAYLALPERGHVAALDFPMDGLRP
jgi:hypothetical protein